MKQSDISQLKEGAIIVYVLLPKDRPTNPKFEYRGRIKKVDLALKRVVVDILNKGRPTNPKFEYRGRIKKVDLALKRVVVDILNKGYEGDEEPVFFDQIVCIEQGEGE